MKIQLNDPETRFPIELIQGTEGWAMTLLAAKKLLSGLQSAVGAVEKHFRCPVLDRVFMGHEFWCTSRGSVKQPDGSYLCKRHARKAPKGGAK